MDYNSINIYECIFQKITTMKITLISNIFAYISDFPIRFIYILLKSQKLQSIIKNILENINIDNNNILDKQTLISINKFKLAQKIYLAIIEKIIEQKIEGYKFDFPELNKISGINIDEKYAKVVHNNLKEFLYEKYNSLIVFCSDIKYKNRNNKWFFKRFSERNNEYFNNCAFLIDDIESIQIIIYLLYYNNYLNFKNNLTITKIKKYDSIKLILDDTDIKYALEYKRAIVINKTFINQLLKSNFNFYICSIENKNKLYNIIFQKNNNYKERNDKIYLQDKNKFNIHYKLNEKENNKNMNMIINKSYLSFKEINLYLTEYESVNAETLELQNFLIESSLYDYFFSSYKYSKSNNNINEDKDKNKNQIKNYSKNNKFERIYGDLMFFNFEKDFFEINNNNKIEILHCSELINYINKSKNIINLYLNNFPLSYLKFIKNPLIELISIDNIFNFDNDIHFYCSNINHNLPKLKKIKIRYSNFYESKEIIYIKRNNKNIKYIKLNLKSGIIKIECDLIDNNLSEVYSVIESFIGLDKIDFGLGLIQLYNYDNNDIIFDMFINNNNAEYLDKIIKQVGVNILKYLNYDNLLIYGHILNEIKIIDYLLLDEIKNNNDFFGDFYLIEKLNIINAINNNINNFSESKFSIINTKDYLFVPFINNLILKISTRKLEKLLSNCIFGEEVSLFCKNIEFFYNIKKGNIKKLNIYFLDEKNIFINKEFNLRYIYRNIPSLERISINLYNTSIIFPKIILPFLYFKIEYINIKNKVKNKKILILDFENNHEVLVKCKHKYLFKIHSKDDVIFLFNDKKIIFKNNQINIKYFSNNNKKLMIFIFIYILTLIIIIYKEFISI